MATDAGQHADLLQNLSLTLLGHMFRSTQGSQSIWVIPGSQKIFQKGNRAFLLE